MAKGRGGATTIGDVAERAGVSRATVSRVINGSAAVDEGIARRVREAAAALNYHPSSLARGLSLGATGTVVIAVPDLRDPQLPAFCEVLQARAWAAGLHCVISVHDPEGRASAPLDEAVRRGDVLLLVGSLPGRSDGGAGLVGRRVAVGPLPEGREATEAVATSAWVQIADLMGLSS